MSLEYKNPSYIKQIKKDTSILSIGILIYSFLMICVMMAWIIFRTSIEIIRTDGNMDIDIFSDTIANSGIPYLISVFIGIIFLSYFYRKIEKEQLTKCSKSMSLKSFIAILFCFMGAQIIFSFGSYLMEAFLNIFGYSINSEIESASIRSNSISMFLYASILGPITEEIIFRGFIMRSLEKYGKILAIVTSAVLFGAFHGNLIQGIFAAIVGLVLGYIAMEYSLKWSIALHIINNFVFGDLMQFLLERLSENVQNNIWIVTQLIFFIGALIILFKNKGNIKEYLNENKTSDFKYVFTSGGMIVFLMFMMVSGIDGIQKL